MLRTPLEPSNSIVVSFDENSREISAYYRKIDIIKHGRGQEQGIFQEAMAYATGPQEWFEPLVGSMHHWDGSERQSRPS